MFKFDSYYYKDEDDLKMSLNWFIYEDVWFQRFLFDSPVYTPEKMFQMKEKNLNRCRWFTIRLNIFHFKVNIDIRLKKVGNVYYGRLMNDDPKPSPFKKDKEEQ